MKRILIPTVTCGAGHLQAAAALEESWKNCFPDDDVKKVDVLDFTPKLYKKIYSQGYIKLIEHAPELYGRFFVKTDDAQWIRRVNPLRRIASHWIAHPFKKYYNEFAPDAVICPHFMPLEIMGSLLGKLQKRPKIVSVVTDFEAHAFWMEPCVDLYCVAAEQTKDQLVARGVPKHQVVPTGIPISLRFSSIVNRAKVRKTLRLKADLPTLLILGGGFGMIPLPKILQELQKVNRPIQIVAVAGRNEKVRLALASKKFRYPTTVLGFVDNMHEIMAVSDLIITKPGGLTTSEALAMKKPQMIINPIPGQESANSDFLLERGAAIKVNRIEDIPFRLNALLTDSKLRKLQNAAELLGRPKAAEHICRETYKLLQR